VTDIPDHVGRMAVRMLNESTDSDLWSWPLHRTNEYVITLSRALMMEPPEPPRDPFYDEAIEAWVMDAGLLGRHLRPRATPAAIAASLTEAQRRAVLDLSAFSGIRWPLLQWEGPFQGHSARTFNALHRRGLAWGRENYTSRWVGLTPLGLAVRAHLEKN